MRRIALLLVLVAGCSSPAKSPVEVEQTPDQDVPLLAPDEAEASKANARLTETKRIGGGPDDTSVDGKHRGTTAQASTRAAPTTTRAMVPRGYYRGTGAYSSSTGTSAANFNTAPAAPAAGGNYPAVPSFGSPAAH